MNTAPCMDAIYNAVQLCVCYISPINAIYFKDELHYCSASTTIKASLGIEA